jgi:NADH:ubiquinone oxidoreductase subunit C
MIYFSSTNSYLKKKFSHVFFFVSYLKKLFSTDIKYFVFNNNQLNIYLKSFNLDIFYFFKKHTFFQYKQLTDIIAIDISTKTQRFFLVYSILSIKFNNRINLFCPIQESFAINTISSLYSSAVWSEREVWDLFGIFFFLNQDLRRILTDYGFEGHPLRKDFPLSGFIELFYDESQQQLYYSKLALTQEYRDFKFENPWLK